jgi:anti-sigma B factor antagonist
MVRPERQLADPTDDPRDGMSLVVVGDVPSARVWIVGDLDVRTAPRLGAFLNDLLDAGYRHIDLDLSRLTLLAAAGLTVFCGAAARFTQAGGGMRLVEVPPRIRRILTITKLDTVLVVSASGVEIPGPAEPGSSEH